MLTSDDKSIDARGLVQGKNSSNRETITRLFQTKSITACGKLIITALSSKSSSGSMYSYSGRRHPSPSLSASGFPASAGDWYEISGLT